jgi:hypothetical protein
MKESIIAIALIVEVGELLPHTCAPSQGNGLQG